MLQRFPAKILSSFPQILALLFIGAFAVYAWQEPTQPPPQGNVPAPLNVGSEPQTKEGALTIKGDLINKGSFMSERLCLRGICKMFWSLPTFTSVFGSLPYEYGVSVIQTQSGGYTVLAQGQTTDLSQRWIWLIGVGASGVFAWEKTFHPEGFVYAMGYDFKQTPDGGYIIVGGTGSVLYVIKINSQGQVQWEKLLSAAGANRSEGRAVALTPDGGYVIFGKKDLSATDPATGDPYSWSDFWLIKLRADGEKEWERSFNYRWWDIGIGMTPTSDGGYLLVGASYNQNSEPWSSSDTRLIKVNSTGEVEWVKAFNYRTYGKFAPTILQTEDGGYVLLTDSGLLKLDNLGNQQWIKGLGGAVSVDITTDGGYILAGYSGNAILIKIDQQGNEQWRQEYGGSFYDAGSVARQTLDGGYIMVGSTRSFGEAGSLNVYLIKVDEYGFF